MAEESLDERLALTRIHGRGVFPLKLGKKTNPNSKEPTYEKLPDQNADAPPKKKEIDYFYFARSRSNCCRLCFEVERL